MPRRLVTPSPRAMQNPIPQPEDLSLEELADIAWAQLEAAAGDLSVLPVPVAQFIRVHNAQGVHDNGGFRAFFEHQWPGQPDYGSFVEAYRAIGCGDQADELARVVDTFGFAAPHTRPELRRAYISEHFEDAVDGVPKWGDALCGDEEVWAALLRFGRQHAADFQPVP